MLRDADIGIALFHILGGRALLLPCLEEFKLYGIGRTDLCVGIALTDDAKDVLVDAEEHHGLYGREHLVLHVGDAGLLAWKAEAVEGHHVAFVEMLEGDDGGETFHDEFNALEVIVHEVRLPQRLPQDVGLGRRLRHGEAVGLHRRAVEGAEYRKRKSIRTEADG